MSEAKTWTIEQFANFLNCSPRTLRRKVAAKKVPALRDVDGLKRFDYQEIMRWWESVGKDGRATYQPDISTI